MKIHILFGMIGFILLSGCNRAAEKNPRFYDADVSRELAGHRKAQIKNLKYELSFNIPRQKEAAIEGDITLRFDLASRQEVLIDFREEREKIKEVIANGVPVDKVRFENEHIILPASSTVEGANGIRIRFTAGNQSLNRNDEYLYTLLVPDRARTVFPCFDIIQVEFYELLSLGFLLPENVQTIFVHHELRYIRNEKEIALFREQTAGDRMLFHIAKDFERSALLKYKDVIVLTEVDRKIMEDFIGRKDHIYTSPAVVQVGDRLEQPFVPVQSGRLTFVGSEDHFPNLDAVAWFCHEVIPHLRKRHFSFTLQVIGKWRGECINRLQSEYPELKLVGYVEDLGSFLKGSVAVVPIRIGSGMRMKILDAVLSKVPFVTTAKGVEGIDFKDGEDCLIVDDPAGFAEAVIALSSNPQLQRQLVTHAEDSLRQVYNPGQMQERRLAVYEQILGDKVG